MAVSLSTLGGAGWQFLDDNGDPLNGGKLMSYLAGTTTPAATYTSNTGSTPNPNPIILDSAGRPPAEVWLTDSVNYKFVLLDSTNVEIRTYDYIYGVMSAGASSLQAQLAASNGASLVGFIQDGSGAVATTVLLKDQQDLSPMDFGAVGNNNGTQGNGTNDTAAINAMVSAWPNRMANGAGRSFRVSATLPTPSVPAGFNLFNGQIVSDQWVTVQDEYSVTVLGYAALTNNTYIPEQFPASGGRNFAAGNHIVAVGRQAMQANTTGRRNTAVGSRSLISNTTGYYNTSIGAFAMEGCDVGFENTAVGTQALQGLKNGVGNTAIGLGAAGRVSSGSNNAILGYSAGGGSSAIPSVGNGNSVVGYRAMLLNTTGTDNVCIGRESMISNTDGSENVAIGPDTLTNNLTGSDIVAVGMNCLHLRTSGNATAVGAYALDASVTSIGGEAFGYQALTNSTGDYNSAFGFQTMTGLTTGSNNIAMGRASGASISTGSGNTMLGYSADSTSGSTNSTSLGNGATCTGDNQVTLGNNAITTIRAQVTSITSLSDGRFKANVRDVEIPDEFLEEVRIVTFDWISSDMPAGPQTGVIAQELDALQEKYGMQWLGLVDKTNPDRWEATPHKLLFPLLNKFGKMSARQRDFDERLKKLEGA